MQTRVLVPFPVSQVQYDTHEYSTVLQDQNLLNEILYQERRNKTRVNLQSSLRTVVTSTTQYEEFAWPTELQMFTTLDVNGTVQHINRTVENDLPFI